MSENNNNTNTTSTTVTNLENDKRTAEEIAAFTVERAQDPTTMTERLDETDNSPRPKEEILQRKPICKKGLLAGQSSSGSGNALNKKERKSSCKSSGSRNVIPFDYSSSSRQQQEEREHSASATQIRLGQQEHHAPFGLTSNISHLFPPRYGNVILRSEGGGEDFMSSKSEDNLLTELRAESQKLRKYLEFKPVPVSTTRIEIEEEEEEKKGLEEELSSLKTNQVGAGRLAVATGSTIPEDSHQFPQFMMMMRQREEKGRYSHAGAAAKKGIQWLFQGLPVLRDFQSANKIFQILREQYEELGANNSYLNLAYCLLEMIQSSNDRELWRSFVCMIQKETRKNPDVVTYIKYILEREEGASFHIGRIGNYVYDSLPKTPPPQAAGASMMLRIPNYVTLFRLQLCKKQLAKCLILFFQRMVSTRFWSNSMSYKYDMFREQGAQGVQKITPSNSHQSSSNPSKTRKSLNIHTTLTLQDLMQQEQMNLLYNKPTNNFFHEQGALLLAETPSRFTGDLKRPLNPQIEEEFWSNHYVSITEEVSPSSLSLMRRRRRDMEFVSGTLPPVAEEEEEKGSVHAAQDQQHNQETTTRSQQQQQQSISINDQTNSRPMEETISNENNPPATGQSPQQKAKDDDDVVDVETSNTHENNNNQMNSNNNTQGEMSAATNHPQQQTNITVTETTLVPTITMGEIDNINPKPNNTQVGGGRGEGSRATQEEGEGEEEEEEGEDWDEEEELEAEIEEDEDEEEYQGERFYLLESQASRTVPFTIMQTPPEMMNIERREQDLHVVNLLQEFCEQKEVRDKDCFGDENPIQISYIDYCAALGQIRVMQGVNQVQSLDANTGEIISQRNATSEPFRLGRLGSKNQHKKNNATQKSPREKGVVLRSMNVELTLGQQQQQQKQQPIERDVQEKESLISLLSSTRETGGAGVGVAAGSIAGGGSQNSRINANVLYHLVNENLNPYLLLRETSIIELMSDNINNTTSLSSSKKNTNNNRLTTKLDLIHEIEKNEASVSACLVNQFFNNNGFLFCQPTLNMKNLEKEQEWKLDFSWESLEGSQNLIACYILSAYLHSMVNKNYDMLYSNLIRDGNSGNVVVKELLKNLRATGYLEE